MKELLERYQAGGAALREAVAGLTSAQLTHRYDPAKWSIQEIALHTADMDMVATFRMKRILSEPSPEYPGVDQDLWAVGLSYQTRKLEPALALLDALRAEMAEVLAGAPDAAWSKTGRHNEAGEQTLQAVVEKYVGHLEHHVGQIRAIRQRMGW